MSMTYTSLVSPKGTSGSIANWVGYTKLDLATILDESQSLLFSMLRVRDMKKEWTFGLSAGQSEITLPARFLDPDSDLYLIGYGMKLKPTTEQTVTDRRFYDNTLSGSFGSNPFTTTLGSASVAVEQTGHDLTQGSTVTITGAAAVGGLTLNGTFPVTAIVDADNFTISTGDDLATSAATGGGSAATYTANKLIAGCPCTCAVWDGALKFDTALDTASAAKMIYYRAPALLSATNESNWLTDRYPMLLRKACQAAAADFMKDDGEYQKALTALQALIQRTDQEGDLIYRGASFGTETP